MKYFVGLIEADLHHARIPLNIATRRDSIAMIHWDDLISPVGSGRNRDLIIGIRR